MSICLSSWTPLPCNTFQSINAASEMQGVQVSIPLSFVFVLLVVWLHFLDEFLVWLYLNSERFLCRKPFYAIWKVLWLRTRSCVLLRAVVRFFGHVRKSSCPFILYCEFSYWFNIHTWTQRIMLFHLKQIFPSFFLVTVKSLHSYGLFVEELYPRTF